jgi:hypothetical protein
MAKSKGRTPLRKSAGSATKKREPVYESDDSVPDPNGNMNFASGGGGGDSSEEDEEVFNLGIASDDSDDDDDDDEDDNSMEEDDEDDDEVSLFSISPTQLYLCTLAVGDDNIHVETFQRT